MESHQIIDWEEKFKKSGMTLNEWNHFILDIRQKVIDEEIKKARDLRIEVEKRTEFICDEIIKAGNKEANRIIEEAKQYVIDLKDGKINLEQQNISIMDENYLSTLKEKTNSWVEDSNSFVTEARRVAEENYNLLRSETNNNIETENSLNGKVR